MTTRSRRRTTPRPGIPPAAAPPLPPPHAGARARARILDAIEAALPTATPHELSQLTYALAALLRAAAPTHEAHTPPNDQVNNNHVDLVGMRPEDFTHEELAEVRATIQRVTQAARQRRTGKPEEHHDDQDQDDDT